MQNAQIPATQAQLLNELVSRFRYTPVEANDLLTRMLQAGLIQVSGGLISVCQPTAPEAATLRGLAMLAAGRSSGAVSADKIREYLQNFDRISAAQGGSRRG